jgi:hypothetical protein
MRSDNRGREAGRIGTSSPYTNVVKAGEQETKHSTEPRDVGFHSDRCEWTWRPSLNVA